MKKFIEASYIALLAATSTVTFANETSEAQNMSIDMFPAKFEGYTRHVIRLPKLEGEARLELLPGQVVQGDCNIQSANVAVEKGNVDGWGYSYYKISEFNIDPAMTMMACPTGVQEMKVIAGNDQLQDMRYNDRMPLVVFVEDGMTLDYKIWRVSPEEASIEAPAG